MTSVRRVDAELVRRGLARSRGQAGELVRAGRVLVDGTAASKPAMTVRAETAIEVDARPGDADVGRGAAKLRGALVDLAVLRRDADGPTLTGCRAIDVGAGTGGFTQVLLEHGVRSVTALDVGHDQLAAAIAADARVDERSGTNIRDVSADDLGGPFELLVADLSFVSLTLVLPSLAGLVRPGSDLILLVKPQFEIGRSRLGRDGVVRSPELRQEAVDAVRTAAEGAHLSVRGVVPSRVPGASGNVEYFLWATR